MEVVQVSFSMLSLASKVISTYQKSITTQQIIDGELEDTERFTLPCCVQVRQLDAKSMPGMRSMGEGMTGLVKRLFLRI